MTLKGCPWPELHPLWGDGSSWPGSSCPGQEPQGLRVRDYEPLRGLHSPLPFSHLNLSICKKILPCVPNNLSQASVSSVFRKKKPVLPAHSMTPGWPEGSLWHAC